LRVESGLVSTRRDWGNIFRIVAAAGFAASAALHLATFTPLPPAVGAASAVTLFLGALALLAAMIVRLRAAGAPLRGQGTVRVVDWRRLAAFVPEGPRRATLAVLAYVQRAAALRPPAALLFDSAVVFSLRGAAPARRRRPVRSLTLRPASA
jgi:hypothetical protein